MASPPKGWARLQSSVLAEVRHFDPQALRWVPEVRVTTLLGSQVVERRTPAETRGDDDDQAAAAQRVQRKADEAARREALLRALAGKDKAPCRVLDRLYIGGAGAARNLKALRKVGVTHILNASPAVPCFFADNPPERAFRYLSLRLWDDPGADLGEHLPAALAFIEEGRRAGGVLVHCLAGQSRSAALVAAHLVAGEGLALSDALRTLRAARPGAAPNAGFMRQLAELERSADSMRGAAA